MDLTPRDSFITPSFNRALICFLDSFIGSTAAGSRRTLVAKTSMNSRTRALSRDCSCGDPLKVIFDINSSGVSMDPSSESESNRFAFHSMSSLSSSGSNRSFFFMSSSSEIVGCL